VFSRPSDTFDRPTEIRPNHDDAAVRVVGPLDAEFLVRLRVQHRVAAVQRHQEATELLDRPADLLGTDGR
jgi:hypothetical protein